MNKSEEYRPGVGIVLVNRQGLVFAARRIDTKEPAWQMPQGGIDKGENPEQAALRELVEETGVTSAAIIDQTQGWLSYDLPADIASRIWGGQYKGQKQKWFLIRFDGQDSEVDINGEMPEFAEWAWKPPKDILNSIVAFKKPLYTAVFEAFAHHLMR